MAQITGDAVDDLFDQWSKGTIKTQDLRKSLKKIGVTHSRLTPTQNAGSTAVYNSDGSFRGNY